MYKIVLHCAPGGQYVALQATGDGNISFIDQHGATGFAIAFDECLRRFRVTGRGCCHPQECSVFGFDPVGGYPAGVLGRVGGGNFFLQVLQGRGVGFAMRGDERRGRNIRLGRGGEQTFDLLYLAVEGESLDVFPGGFAVVLDGFRVLDVVFDLGGEIGGVPRRGESAGAAVGDEFRYAADARGDDWSPTGHGFGNGDGLVFGADRGQDEELGLCVEVGDLLVGLPAPEAVGEVLRVAGVAGDAVNVIFVAISFMAFADKVDVDLVLGKQGECFDQAGQAFVWPHVADE